LQPLKETIIKGRKKENEIDDKEDGTFFIPEEPVKTDKSEESEKAKSQELSIQKRLGLRVEKGKKIVEVGPEDQKKNEKAQGKTQCEK
jgi:hypothetical protein